MAAGRGNVHVQGPPLWAHSFTTNGQGLQAGTDRSSERAGRLILNGEK